MIHAPAFPVQNKRVTELDWADFYGQMMIQVRSFFEVMKAVVKPMAKSGGNTFITGANIPVTGGEIF